MLEFSLPDSPHFQNMIAILLGMTLGAVVVGAVESAGHALHPVPPALEAEDPEAKPNGFESADPISLTIIIVSWGVGILAACWVASLFGKEQGGFCCIVVGILFVSLALLILYEQPAPEWFSFCGIAILVPSGVAGWKLGEMTYRYLQSYRRDSHASEEDGPDSAAEPQADNSTSADSPA